MFFQTMPNLVDLLICTVMILSVPLLVSIYLKGPQYSERFRTTVILLGILWICFGLVSEDLLEALGLFARMDSWSHTGLGDRLASGLEPHFWDTIPTGNKAYGAYLSVLFSLGVYVAGARSLNAFLGLWGGLVLASFLKSYLMYEKRRELALLVIIFFPSTVFWTSNNLKEGLTYFGVCLIVVGANTLGTSMGKSLIMGISGIGITGFMRPHVCLACLASIAIAQFMAKRRILFAILALAIVPLLFSKLQELTRNEFASVSDATAFLETQRAGLLRAGGSAHSEAPGLIFISGAVNIFFRPFLWESRSPFMAICAIEIWTLTIVMIWSWCRLTQRERWFVLKDPAMVATIIFLLLMSILFSYLPNDGLLARQRVQIIPALMILTFFPFAARSALRRPHQLPKMAVRRDFGRNQRGGFVSKPNR